jgi:hypothetical protein
MKINNTLRAEAKAARDKMTAVLETAIADTISKESAAKHWTPEDLAKFDQCNRKFGAVRRLAATGMVPGKYVGRVVLSGTDPCSHQRPFGPGKDAYLTVSGDSVLLLEYEVSNTQAADNFETKEGTLTHANALPRSHDGRTPPDQGRACDALLLRREARVRRWQEAVHRVRNLDDPGRLPNQGGRVSGPRSRLSLVEAPAVRGRINRQGRASTSQRTCRQHETTMLRHRADRRRIDHVDRLHHLRRNRALFTSAQRTSVCVEIPSAPPSSVHQSPRSRRAITHARIRARSFAGYRASPRHLNVCSARESSLC